jgi:superfamily II DNA/RNA helicase
MGPDDKIIVFVGKKTEVEYLSSEIGYSKIFCRCIHENMEQYYREKALEELRTGVVHI